MAGRCSRHALAPTRVGRRRGGEGRHVGQALRSGSPPGPWLYRCSGLVVRCNETWVRELASVGQCHDESRVPARWHTPWSAGLHEGSCPNAALQGFKRTDRFQRMQLFSAAHWNAAFMAKHTSKFFLSSAGLILIGLARSIVASAVAPIRVVPYRLCSLA